ncbi:MAG TPA: alpha/beta fold hydrolase [Jatrophihabitantaceae bacterium]|nr:alpha/beta fold hydrolase [Jatrophihabitantaceae bacterium]
MPAADRITLATIDGVRLSALHYDSGHRDLAAVVAHGFTGSSGNPAVRRIVGNIVSSGMSVLSIDFRGHGRSGGFCTAGDLEIHDVAAAVAWLRGAGYARVAVLGWSMGGSAVLRHAGLGGDADAVVSVSSPGTWFERGTRSMRLVHWLCETRSGRLACRVARRTRLAHDGWQDVPKAPAEVVASIAPRPLLIVHGDGDHYFPMHHVEALAAAAPEAEVWIEPGMGHAETATTAQLVARIVEWVRTVVVASPVCDDGVRD